jgi:hypothetical protein
VARIALSGITVAIDGLTAQTSTTIAGVGGYAVIITTTLPALGVTLTSGYLSALIGDIAVSHLCSIPNARPIIDQHVLPAGQLGETHARACLLNHISELRNALEAHQQAVSTVSATIADVALEGADHAWRSQHDPNA